MKNNVNSFLWFRQSVNDCSLFVRTENKSTIVPLMYIDDIISACSNIYELENKNSLLKLNF